MCNLHWCYTFCTGVTLFALVLHLNCTALSQSESSNFFMYIITMCYLHWCYTFCTGVTLFALALHLNCTALSQSQSINFFMCIIKLVILQRTAKKCTDSDQCCHKQTKRRILDFLTTIFEIAQGNRFLQRPSIKPGTWNIPEHAGTFRNIPEHRIIIIIMRNIRKIRFF